jgi:hypothetical protein
MHGATPLHLACACIGTMLPDDASEVVGLLTSNENVSQSLGSGISGEPSVITNAAPGQQPPARLLLHSPSSLRSSARHLTLPDPSGPLRQLLPLQEASPLEVAAAAQGDTGAMIEALVSHGADVKGECGVRALMVCLIGGKRTRARTLLHHQVRLFLFLERVFSVVHAFLEQQTQVNSKSID